MQKVQKQDRNESTNKTTLLQKNCVRVVFLCFHPYLVSVLLTGPSLQVANFYAQFFTSSYVAIGQVQNGVQYIRYSDLDLG